MKIKTCDLIGAQLDWAVAKCEDEPVRYEGGCIRPALGQFMPDEDWYKPSDDWSQGGPIIERERIHLCPVTLNDVPAWEAWIDERMGDTCHFGPTPLIAAMCCYVASKLGDEVEIPEELA